jgi:SAM-dependent methyltransferase
MNKPMDAAAFPPSTLPNEDVELTPRGRLALYLAVGLAAGSVIALQIDIMRVFAVGNWTHFGSLVVSLAMLGFGLVSAVMASAKSWFQRHWLGAATFGLGIMGPLAVAANLYVQSLKFNPIYLVSDPMQKWKLLEIFLASLTPFLGGALFLGCVFLKSNKTFGRVYFADLAGAGLSGLVFLGAMYLFDPINLIAVPLALWLAACVAWTFLPGAASARIPFALAAILAFALHFLVAPALGLSRLAINDYKGASYARRLPEAKLVYESASPFGFLQAYTTSYLHFAPGLSDNAAFNLPSMPANAYMGLYVDSDGPIGVMRHLSPKEDAYFRYLPMYYPYVIKKDPKVFVAQFGGGISTEVALAEGAKDVTVAEGNRAILHAFEGDVFKSFTDNILGRVHVVDYEGRHYLAHTSQKFDVVDLSLADSTGLSNPGGFAVVEKFPYTQEAMETYMRALAPGGVLSVTIWNKEEPPKSVLRLYMTLAAASRDLDGAAMSKSFFVASSYLSTATVLYKRGGFTEDEVKALRKYTHAMSFDEIYSPGLDYVGTQNNRVLDDYAAQFSSSTQNGPTLGAAADATAPADDATAPSDKSPDDSKSSDDGVLPSTLMGRMVWAALVKGDASPIAQRYIFNIQKLTNDHPYFTGYVKTKDLPAILTNPERLEPLQDEWGYLLIWATLGIACLTAAVLLVIPLVFGWRSIFSKTPGKARTVLYFACLGAGYIMVEVGLIAHFVLALGNPTVSATILITGMLVFSGLGALLSERVLPVKQVVMPILFVVVAAMLAGYAIYLDAALDAIGAYPYAERLALCFALIAPPAFLMGFPMSVAMTTLGRLGKEHMFIWAWGVNGCFSVIGAAAAPVLATSFGLASVIEVAALAYFVAWPAFGGVLSQRTI